MIRLACFSVCSLLVSAVSAQSISSGVLSYFAYRQPQQVPPKSFASSPKPFSKRDLSVHQDADLLLAARPAVVNRQNEMGMTSLAIESLFEISEVEPDEKLQLKSAKSSAIRTPVLARLFGNWRVDVSGGLSRPVLHSGSQLRLGYSDIFETGGDPDKGGHGISILVQHTFRKSHP